MIAVVMIMLVFKKSENLAAAYGLAVTGSMTITGIMMILILSRTTKANRPVLCERVHRDTPLCGALHHPQQYHL